MGRLEPLRRRQGRQRAAGPTWSPSTARTTGRAPASSSAASSSWCSSWSGWVSTSRTGPTSTCTPPRSRPPTTAPSSRWVTTSTTRPACDGGSKAARDAGVNLLFLGANACFRKIRLEDSDTGPFRREVNYRSAEADPVTAIDPLGVNRELAVPAVERARELRSSATSTSPTRWTATCGSSTPRTGCSRDRACATATSSPAWWATSTTGSPRNSPPRRTSRCSCHSPVVVRGSNTFADVTWYTTDSGAGVFAVGTFEWIKRLAPDTAGRAPSAADPEAALQAVTRQRADGGVRRAGGTGTPRCPQPGAVRHRPRLRGGSTPDLNATPTRFCVATRDPEVAARSTERRGQRGASGSNGPLPIWSRTVTTGGLVSDAALPVGAVDDERVTGDEACVRRREERRGPAELLALPDPQRGLAGVLVVGAVEVALDVGGHVLVRERGRARGRSPGSRTGPTRPRATR